MLGREIILWEGKKSTLRFNGSLEQDEEKLTYTYIVVYCKYQHVNKEMKNYLLKKQETGIN